MSFNLDTVTDLVKKAAELFAGPVVPAVLQIGQGVLDLIDDVKVTVNSTDADALQKMRDELERLVLAHADVTEEALRGAE